MAELSQIANYWSSVGVLVDAEVNTTEYRVNKRKHKRHWDGLELLVIILPNQLGTLIMEFIFKKRAKLQFPSLVKGQVTLV